MEAIQAILFRFALTNMTFRTKAHILFAGVIITCNLLGPLLFYGSTAMVSSDTASVPDNTFATAQGFGYFFHSDTVAISGTDYYRLFKHTPGDSAGTTLTASFLKDNPGRIRPSPNDGKFVFPLSGLSEIPAATWYVTYRVRRTAAQLTAHVDIDIHILKSNGTVRTTIATEVANTTDISGNKWTSLTATYSFPGYTVVNQTDYLEIDLFADATAVTKNSDAEFRIDDIGLLADEQTRVREDFP